MCVRHFRQKNTIIKKNKQFNYILKKNKSTRNWPASWNRKSDVQHVAIRSALETSISDSGQPTSGVHIALACSNSLVSEVIRQKDSQIDWEEKITIWVPSAFTDCDRHRCNWIRQYFISISLNQTVFHGIFQSCTLCSQTISVNPIR